ncbi:hypothetical protein JX265_004403 [Neoarthrinium moseri]|uniref:Uncharacterized protein n=1 Tax=Neoarthrinium moseri TaxID=1658444 RepID=A0A9P9WQS4_9PEZI|nr:hypothetical protein JX265_004403 [Neoarthrinium moseri]
MSRQHSRPTLSSEDSADHDPFYLERYPRYFQHQKQFTVQKLLQNHDTGQEKNPLSPKPKKSVKSLFSYDSADFDPFYLEKYRKFYHFSHHHTAAMSSSSVYSDEQPQPTKVQMRGGGNAVGRTGKGPEKETKIVTKDLPKRDKSADQHPSTQEIPGAPVTPNQPASSSAGYFEGPRCDLRNPKLPSPPSIEAKYLHVKDWVLTSPDELEHVPYDALPKDDELPRAHSDSAVSDGASSTSPHPSGWKHHVQAVSRVSKEHSGDDEGPAEQDIIIGYEKPISPKDFVTGRMTPQKADFHSGVERHQKLLASQGLPTLMQNLPDGGYFSRDRLFEPFFKPVEGEGGASIKPHAQSGARDSSDPLMPLYQVHKEAAKPF